jgi:tRNA threonylcarbamoyladenosine biosynthesis protein TsaB
MSLILSIETSTSVCSAAIHDAGRLLGVAEVHIEQSHAAKLAVLIDGLQAQTGVALNQLKAIGITSGPGSYTGLRIGTSTAKGLCYALNIPLLAVNTLELMASQVIAGNTEGALLCPMIDARRMEVYSLLQNVKGERLQPVEAKIIDENSYAEWLENNTVIFFGDGAAKCRDVITHRNARFIDGVYPSAGHLGNIIFEKFRREAFEDLVQFEPFYLKEFMIKKPAGEEQAVLNKIVQ